MEYPVIYEGKTVGTVSVVEEACWVCWKAVCAVDTTDILRLYVVKEGAEPFRIGVLEPDAQASHVLRLDRAAPRSELQAAGYDPLPERYVLSEHGQGLRVPHVKAYTGDAKLDALIERGQAHCDRERGKITVRIPFAWGQACPMAFALTACEIRDGYAILHYRKRE